MLRKKKLVENEAKKVLELHELPYTKIVKSVSPLVRV